MHLHRQGLCVCAGRDPETGVNQYAPGDLCIYIPPDSVLPPELSDRLGCTKYLAPLAKNADGVRPPGGRVRVARLRGEPSYGLIMPADDPTLPVGYDVAALLGITKWEPPPLVSDGDALPDHALFHGYSEIENYRNFPDLIREGEEVLFTEKIHGKNCRLGLARDEANEWTLMAGSNNLRRKEFDDKGRRSQFWQVLTDPVRTMLEQVVAANPGVHGVVLFGELYGAGVQDMWYGCENGRFQFRAFDLAVDGVYLDFDRKTSLFEGLESNRCPFCTAGRFSEHWSRSTSAARRPCARPHTPGGLRAERASSSPRSSSVVASRVVGCSTASFSRRSILNTSNDAAERNITDAHLQNRARPGRTLRVR